MENILLTLNFIFAIILIILILLQKSEGGALGIGVSQESFMFSRSAGNFFTKATAIIATLFIICSLSLTIIGRKDLPTSTSVIDKIEEKKDFQDLNNAEKMKANLLKKITLETLITMNIEEKRNLGLKNTVGEVEIEPFK